MPLVNLMILSPVISTLCYLLIARKVGLVIIKKNFSVYIIVMILIFYVSFFFGDYVTPVINSQIYGVNARIMGLSGILEDYIIPLSIVIPLYLTANFLLGVKYKNAKWKYINLLLYYSINFATWWGLTAPLFSRKEY